MIIMEKPPTAITSYLCFRIGINTGITAQQTEWIYFSKMWWESSNDKGIYSRQSTEPQSGHQSSPSLVDTSSFHIICGGKSPVWRAEIGLLLPVRMVQKTSHTISLRPLSHWMEAQRERIWGIWGIFTGLHLAILGQIQLGLNTGF